MTANGYDLPTKQDVLLGEQRFFLNPSKSKYVAISLAHSLNYAPCVVIAGNKREGIMLTEQEWNVFLTYKEDIDKFLSSPTNEESYDAGSFFLEFKKLPYTWVIKISTNDTCIHLGPNSVSTLWKILPIIHHRITTLKKQQFNSTLKILQLGVKDCEDCYLTNTALNIMDPIKNINNDIYSMALELIYIHPALLKEDLQL